MPVIPQSARSTSTRGTAASIPSTVQFVQPGAAVQNVWSARVEVDADGDLRTIYTCNGVDQYVLYASDRKGRKDSSNPGIRFNLWPLKATSKGFRKQRVGQYDYPEINHLTPSGKSYRGARG